MSDISLKQFTGKAFVSCSLRLEDQPFVNFVENILKEHGIQPIGTVGKFSASPENPTLLMKRNIPDCDFVVICATPRYIQRDLNTGKITYGLSEMIHVEAGIAFAYNKPIVLFVQEGTNVGSFLPNVTQYIVLNGEIQDFITKKHLVINLLNSANNIANRIKAELQEGSTVNALGKVAVAGLAIYGGVKLIEAFFGNDPEE